MKNWLLMTLLAILFFACKKEDDSIYTVDFEDFIGVYNVESRHISGIKTFYDSIGNQVGMGIDTVFVGSELVIISQYNKTDTLLLEGLINSFFEAQRATVKCVYGNDSLHIFHEFSVEGVRNNFIRGRVWKENDSLFLDYRWDKSDTWSSGALPEYGEVVGRGAKVN